MANSTIRTFRGVIEDKPLTHAERRAIIEAPWPAINVWHGKSWGGLARRETRVSDIAPLSWDWAQEEDGGALMVKRDRALLWGIKFALLVPILTLLVPQLSALSTLGCAAALAALPAVR